ncbi:hypothetical protein TWF192_001602, partial [Orbilia oligospora]
RTCNWVWYRDLALIALVLVQKQELTSCSSISIYFSVGGLESARDWDWSKSREEGRRLVEVGRGWANEVASLSLFNSPPAQPAQPAQPPRKNS